MKLMSTAPGTIASATSASCQLSTTSTLTAITSRIMEIDGDTIASCSNPVVESMSPVRRDSTPPVFMSCSLASGRCTSRSNNEWRSDSITRVFTSRCR